MKLPFPTVSSSASVSNVAKTMSDSPDGNCERCPIYSHWFGIEMYNAYQSAKMQVGSNTSEPITIKFQNDEYGIKRDALHNAVAAKYLSGRITKY